MNSGEWFFRFVILNRLSHKSIHLNNWSEFPRPPLKTGAELLFELISQRYEQGYEQGSTLIASSLPFEEWTETFGAERLTGALLDRLTHHVNILEMNGESYRLNQSRAKRRVQ